MELTSKSLFLVIDVESMGLHGQAFSVGGVLCTGAGETLKEFCFAMPRLYAAGDRDDQLWVNQNVPIIGHNVIGCKDLCDSFWREWESAKEKGATLAAECAWPVEANFLSECVRQSPRTRKWAGPYPLLDISGVMASVGVDPMASYDRLPRELPIHHPLSDARQSARLLARCIRRIEGRCILDCDSPSFPPDDYERRLCGCRTCVPSKKPVEETLQPA